MKEYILCIDIRKDTHRPNGLPANDYDTPKENEKIVFLQVLLEKSIYR